MELERDSIEKYKEWSMKSGDTKVREIFEKIIKEEEFHYDLLQAEYDNITNTGFWFNMAEFRMDGKF
jgi:rubrerythrin